jgi:hypothetical protein
MLLEDVAAFMTGDAGGWRAEHMAEVLGQHGYLAENL